jgi:Spy/CpxP family protein refolding chaperone
MTKLWVGGLALGAVLLSLILVAAQPPDGKGWDQAKRGAPPRGGPDGPLPDGPPPGAPPGRWVPGRLMPEHLRDELDLTDDQEKQLTDLEREVKGRLLKILTAEQKQKLDELRKRGPGGPPPAPPPPPPPDEERRPEGTDKD